MEHGIGIIGAGKVVTRFILPALTARADVRIVAVASESGDNAKAIADEANGAAWSAGYDALLDNSDVSVVLVCTPPHTHRVIAEAAMRSGRHVLAEKPLCTTYEDARHLIDLADQSAGVFDVTFNNRRREENLWLTERATSGVLGAIELIDIEWLRTKRQPLQPWLTKKALAGGGVMADLGSHMIITALAMLPARRTFRAQCHSRSYGSAGSDVEDLANAVIAVDGETVVNVRVGWDMHLPKSTQVNIAVYGRNGSARNSDFDGAKSDGYGCIFEDFLGAIDGGPRPDLGLVDDTMNALAALYQSAARNGEPVDGTFQAGR